MTDGSVQFNVRVMLLHMYHHSPAHLLPVELQSLVFDSLTLQELLTASHVSKFWRAVALRHQTYWRDVKITALSTTALDFFHARLNAGSLRTVTVQAYLAEIEDPTRLRDIVLPAITRNLHRIDKLHLETDLACDLDVFSALRHPAPRLDTLDVCIVHDSQVSEALPADLFACQAPKLRYVRLTNVELLAHRLPQAFSTLTGLNYCCSEKQSFPTALFAHCKSLQELSIFGRHCSLALADDHHSVLESHELQYVNISLLTGGFDLMQRIPCAAVQHIAVSVNDKLSADLLLRHLRGRLDIRIYLKGKHLYLQYESLDTGMKRTFRCSPEQVAEAYLPPVYVSHDVVSRVEVLHCSGDCAGLLPAFHELRSCTRVALSLGTVPGGEPLLLPPRPLAVPELQRIELSSATVAHLSALDLAAFLDAAFARTSRLVQVMLTNVSMDGDITAIPRERYLVS